MKGLLKELTQQRDSTSTTREETTVQPITETIKTTPTVEITSTTEIVTLSDENDNSNQSKKKSDVFKRLENAWESFRRQKGLPKLLRTDDITAAESCVEYDYNGKLCKIINNRLLCGYNKNKGEIKDAVVDVGNGCRMRNERMECGYETGPWNKSLRRPPARDNTPNKDETLPSVPDDILTPKLRTEKQNSSREIISVNTNKIVTNTQVTTDSTSEPVTTTEGTTESSSELVTTTEAKTYSTPELMTTTQKTTKYIPEITTTQQHTTYNSTSTPELESTTATKTTNTTTDLATSTIKVSSHSTTMTKLENSSQAKFSRILRRNIAEVGKPTTPSASADKTPKRYCVEKGDRIVCYYTKNY